MTSRIGTDAGGVRSLPVGSRTRGSERSHGHPSCTNVQHEGASNSGRFRAAKSVNPNPNIVLLSAVLVLRMASTLRCSSVGVGVDHIVGPGTVGQEKKPGQGRSGRSFVYGTRSRHCPQKSSSSISMSVTSHFMSAKIRSTRTSRSRAVPAGSNGSGSIQTASPGNRVSDRCQHSSPSGGSCSSW